MKQSLSLQSNSINKPPDTQSIFSIGKHKKPNWRLVQDYLSKQILIKKQDVHHLISLAINIFKYQPNVIMMNDPLTIVGDIHGQFYDLLKILELGGNPDNEKYLFLGDYVDRGFFSIQIIILLYSLKVNYPDQIIILRGNHESRQMTSFFNFKEQCLNKYDQQIYDFIMLSMDYLPLACVVNKKFFCVHGGISPQLKRIQNINQIHRFKQTPKYGLFCDLLWSDPAQKQEDLQNNMFKQNAMRGCSFIFGNKSIKTFINENKLTCIIRAHQAQKQGYKLHKFEQEDESYHIITIFSAPNYCNIYKNKGAIIKFKSNEFNIKQFNWTQHPFILPHFMDVFTWSVPFISQKVTQMMYYIVKMDEERYPKQNIIEQFDIVQRQNIEIKLENKIKCFAKFLAHQKKLRQQSEEIMKFKGKCPDDKIQTEKAFKTIICDADQSFTISRSVDIKNERRPLSQNSTI